MTLRVGERTFELVGGPERMPSNIDAAYRAATGR